jgi:hypothetical protein
MMNVQLPAPRPVSINGLPQRQYGPLVSWKEPAIREHFYIYFSDKVYVSKYLRVTVRFINRDIEILYLQVPVYVDFV